MRFISEKLRLFTPGSRSDRAYVVATVPRAGVAKQLVLK